MAYRFGRSHWQDADRLNLMIVCQEHQQWDRRLKAMREIYAKDNYPPGYFTENSCREELERIMSLPTPNLRLDVSKTFVYSRKIMMEKWTEYFAAEVRKDRNSQAELGLVTVRNNVKLMQEALDPDISETRLQELIHYAQQSAERHKNDGDYKRIVGSLESAIADRLTADGLADLKTLVVPPTKPPGENEVTGSRGFLTPTHTTPEDFDMSFFTPPRAPPQMRTLAEALQEAAPVEVSPMEFVEPAPPIMDSLPDDIMEPIPPSPTKEPKTEELEKEQDESESDTHDPVPTSSPKKLVIPASPKSVSKPSTPVKTAQRNPPQKKKEQTPLEVKIEEIKEEEEATPSQSPNPASANIAPIARSRGRPRLHSNATPTTIPNTTKKLEKAVTPRADTPETVPASSRRREESSQEPPVSTSSKRPRHSTVAQMTSRRRKEDTPSSTISSVPRITRSESCLDFPTAPGSPMDTVSREVEVQTDITIRQAVQDISMGERRRSNAPPMFRKGRKSQAPSEAARSVSRNSSASTPGPRSGSVCQTAFRSIGCQTNVRFDIEKDELMVLRVDSHPNFFPTIIELDNSKPVVVSFETCKEIEAENAALGENNYDMGKRAAKMDGKREMTLIIDTDNAIAQRLIEEKSYQLASATSDLPSTGPNDSPVKRHRRDDRAKEDSTKLKLLAMYRALHDNEWSEAFKKPVPLGEATYDKGVLERIDLSMIKKEIDIGTINSIPGFLLRGYRMLSNAVMYNGYDHDVAIYAKNLCAHVMVDITTVPIDDKRAAPPSNKRGGQIEDQPEASRAESMEPEPMTSLGNVGTKRTVFRKDQNYEGVMSVSGSRKGKKSTK